VQLIQPGDQLASGQVTRRAEDHHGARRRLFHLRHARYRVNLPLNYPARYGAVSADRPSKDAASTAMTHGNNIKCMGSCTLNLVIVAVLGFNTWLTSPPAAVWHVVDAELTDLSL
jgi:hypothetical protein